MVSGSARLWDRVAIFIIRRPRLTLGLLVAATLFFGYFLLQLEADTTIRGFVRSPARQLIETIEDDFEEGGYLTLVFESQSDRSLLEPELLHQQLRIMQEIEESHPVTTYSLVEGIDEGLKRIKRKSLLDYDDYSPIAEGILALAGGRTIRDLEKVTAHFVSDPEAIRSYARLRIAAGAALVKPPGKSTTTYRVPFVRAIKALVRPDSGPSPQERKQVLASIRDLADASSTPELRVYAINDELVSHDIDANSKRNALLLGLMLFVVDAICVVSLFRTRRELLVVFTILGTACIWTFGLAGLLGLRLSFLHLISLPILLGTGIDDTFVFGRRLAEERARGRPFPEALRATFAGVGNAIFLTTFTTFVAFLITALSATAEVVFSFYLLVSLSMVIVFVLTTLFQGAIQTELSRHERSPHQAAATASSPTLLERATQRMSRLSGHLVARAAWPVVLGSCLLFGLALASASRLESEVAREDFLPPDVPTHEANEALKRYFGNSRIGYVLFAGDVENPALLGKIKRLEKSLGKYPQIEQVLGTPNVDSVVGLLDKMRIPIDPELDVRSAFDRISTSELRANYVLDTSFRDAADHVLRKTGDAYDGLLMRFFVRGEASSVVLAATGAIRHELEELGLDQIPGVDVRVGGGDITYALESVYYADVMMRSLLLSLVANFLVLCVAWRRLRPVLAAIVPLVLAIAVVMGVMPVFGVTLNPLNLAIGAIVVGLGIDYPIHIIERFEEERRSGGLAPQEAAQRALNTMGPHILASMLTTVVGFCASCVLLLPLSVSFGLLTGAAVAFAYFASIFLLPVLLVKVHARKGAAR